MKRWLIFTTICCLKKLSQSRYMIHPQVIGYLDTTQHQSYFSKSQHTDISSVAHHNTGFVLNK